MATQEEDQREPGRPSIRKMMGKYIMTAGLMLGSLYALNNCGDMSEEGTGRPKEGDCIACDSDLHFKGSSGASGPGCDTKEKDDGFVGIGGFPLEMGDARWLGYQCSDSGYVDRHTGGIGNTLEITGCNDSFYLGWAFGSLMRIIVYEGWNGKIAESGIRIGSSLDEFISKYPGAAKCGSCKDYNGYPVCYEGESWHTTVKWVSSKGAEDEDANLTIDVDENGLIKRIHLDAYGPEDCDRFGADIEEEGQ